MDERAKWLQRLKKEGEAHKDFRKQAKSAQCQFQNEKDGDKPEAIYPIFWANCKITHAAIFSRQPKPDVRRRIADAQGDKQIALAIERGISYQLDTTAFDDHSSRAVMEFIYAGLGQTRVYLKTDTADVPVIDPMTGEPMVDEAGQPITQEEIAGQYACLEYIPWERFRWEPNKDWEDVDWVSFDHFLTGSEIKEKFGLEVDKEGGGPLEQGDKKLPQAQKYAQQYLIHEIWSRKDRKILFLSETVPDLMVKEQDKLRIKGFYPCPRPMMQNIKAGELIPKPEWKYIENICDQINKLTGRIQGLIAQVKDVGFYDAHFSTALAAMTSEGDGARIPLPNLLEKLNGAPSLNGVVVLEDNTNRVNTIQALVAEREKLKGELFEITGISDIVRGASQASETATAQQLKGQWANVRLSEKMREVSMHFRTIFRLMAEIISEHFDPAQIAQQTGIELTPDQIQTMQSDIGRTYAIDVESDSTIAQDEQQDKSDRMEFLQAVTGYLGQIIPQVSSGQMPADLGNQLLLFAVRSFRHGRLLEETIEGLPDSQQQLQKMSQQTQELQGQLDQAQQQIQQLQQQLDKVNADKQQLEMAKVQQKAQADMARTQVEGMAASAQAELDIARADQIRGQTMNDAAMTQIAGQIANGAARPMLPPIA